MSIDNDEFFMYIGKVWLSFRLSMKSKSNQDKVFYLLESVSLSGTASLNVKTDTEQLLCADLKAQCFLDLAVIWGKMHRDLHDSINLTAFFEPIKAKLQNAMLQDWISKVLQQKVSCLDLSEQAYRYGILAYSYFQKATVYDVEKFCTETQTMYPSIATVTNTTSSFSLFFLWRGLSQCNIEPVEKLQIYNNIKLLLRFRRDQSSLYDLCLDKEQMIMDHYINSLDLSLSEEPPPSKRARIDETTLQPGKLSFFVEQRQEADSAQAGAVHQADIEIEDVFTELQNDPLFNP